MVNWPIQELMGKGLGFFHHSKLQSIALNTSIEISVGHSTHFFQHDNLSILYDVGQLRDSLSKFDACVANTQFPPPSKQGLLLTPPRILGPSKFNVQSSGSLASKTLPNLKHMKWSPGTFHGRNLATFCHHRTQIGPSCSVGMDVYTQKLIRLPNFVYYGI